MAVLVESTLATTTVATTSTSSTTTAPPETTAPATTPPPTAPVTVTPAPPTTIPPTEPAVEETTTTATTIWWPPPPPSRNTVDCDGVVNYSAPVGPNRIFTTEATTLTPGAEIIVVVSYGGTSQRVTALSGPSRVAKVSLTLPVNPSKWADFTTGRDGNRICFTRFVW